MSRSRRPRDDSDPSTIGGRLRPLGFQRYAEYLGSDHWHDVRQRYRESDRPQRCACGAKGTQLHHLTYAHLGAEPLTDLLLLCEVCHRKIHGLAPAPKPSKAERKRAQGRRARARRKGIKSQPKPSPALYSNTLSPGPDLRPLPFAVEMPKPQKAPKEKRPKKGRLKKGEPKPWEWDAGRNAKVPVRHR